MDTINIVSLIEKLFTILAIIIGALWTYYNFFRGRIYRSRLEPQIVGKLFENDRYFHIQVSSKLKNVGLSKVNINHNASGIRIYSYEIPEDLADIETAEWNRIGTFPVFEKHGWVESGETIEDLTLLSVEKRNYQVFRLVLRVVGRKKSWTTENILYNPINDSIQKESI